jgi:hypothetical protein
MARNLIRARTRLPSRSVSLVDPKAVEREPHASLLREGERSPSALPQPGGNMTAEIAILNRRAVTFAADSAMTISQTGKAYNSADKIFEISTKNPIGLMVYNQLDYMGMPLDVIIKDFRESSYCCNFDHIYDAAEAFFEYLSKEFSILDKDEDEHVLTLSYAVYMRVRSNFFDKVIKGRTRPPDPHLIFHQTIQEHIARFMKLAFCDCYFDIQTEDFLSRYDSAFGDAIAECFDEILPPLDDDDLKLLKRLGTLALQKSYYSSVHTGFVFGGFGSKQLFPALKSFQFDGMIFGRQKRIEREIIAIDTNAVRARIVPFAQREMVDRFLFGIDQRHEETIVDNVRRNIENLGNSIVGSLPGIRGQTRRRLRENIRLAT